jgi:hypothetical protein
MTIKVIKDFKPEDFLYPLHNFNDIGKPKEKKKPKSGRPQTVTSKSIVDRVLKMKVHPAPSHRPQKVQSNMPMD